MVYETDNDRTCGGELYAICDSDTEFDNGILAGTCTIKNTADEVRASNGIGSIPARSLDCGDENKGSTMTKVNRMEGSKFIGFRVSEKEYKSIKKLAHKAELSVSAYVRKKLFEKAKQCKKRN